ncbi:MAG: hypothetical protein JW849_11255 [Phycisphaerae bacterium]|nr:hypothetical protein [Phycisphaerae bacterium]
MNTTGIVDLLAQTGVVLVGYTEPTTIAMLRPVGAILKIQGREYTLPVSFTMKRPMEEGLKRQYNAELLLPAENGPLAVSVEFTLFAFRDDGSRLVHEIALEPDQIKELHAGKHVEIHAMNDEGDDPKYTIGFQKK